MRPTLVERGPAETHTEPRPLAVVARGVRKAYGDTRALAGVDLSISRGEVFGLLGPNGAGKTTLVEILEGHRTRDEGEVAVFGFDPQTRGRGFRERIGVVLQEGQHIATMKVGEAVRLFSAAYPHPLDPSGVLELVELADRANDRIGTLSGGQRRRLDLAVGIAGDPDLIFLDEPTTGFDPSARRRSWDLLASLRTLGKTILLTTHYMDEAQYLADRVAVIAGGRIVAEGEPDEIGVRGDRSAIVGFRLPDGVGVEDLPVGNATLRHDGHVTLESETPTRDVAALTAWAAGRGTELEGLTVSRPTLEDVYISLTGEEASR
jgi:ABC-2 type transport system ATP-binding protein